MSFRTALAVRNLLVAFRRRILKRNLLTPIGSKILPRRIRFNYQGNFLFTPPCLDLCLSRDGVSDMFEALIPHQPIDPVFPSEASAFSGFMAEHTRYQRPGHADIECAALARHQVSEIAAGAGGFCVFFCAAPNTPWPGRTKKTTFPLSKKR